MGTNKELAKFKGSINPPPRGAGSNKSPSAPPVQTTPANGAKKGSSGR